MTTDLGAELCLARLQALAATRPEPVVRARARSLARALGDVRERREVAAPPDWLQHKAR
jgi:hypothetical protein